MNNKIGVILFVLSAFSIVPQQGIANGDCTENHYVNPSHSPDIFTRFVSQTISSKDYACTLVAIRHEIAHAGELSKQRREDILFSARNSALHVIDNKGVPLETRMQILHSSLISLSTNVTSADLDDVKYDAMTFFKAQHILDQQDDKKASLEAFALGLQLDKRLPKENRLIQYGALPPIRGRLGYLYLKPLLDISRATKGDETKKQLRQQLAFTDYNYSFAIAPGNDYDPKEVEKNANLIIEFTDSLNDIKAGFGFAQNWQWRPIIRAGIAYYRIGKTDMGKKYVLEGIRLARESSNQMQRFDYYINILTSLSVSRFDKSTTLSFAKETLSLCKQLPANKTSTACRRSLPVEIRHIEAW